MSKLERKEGSLLRKNNNNENKVEASFGRLSLQGSTSPGGGALEKFSTVMLVLFFCGLKFDKIVFFGRVSENEGYFFGFEEISMIF